MAQQDQERFVKSWEARRERGQRRFVLTSAVIFFVLVFILTVAVDLFDNSFAEAISSNLAPDKLALRAIFGVLLGFLQWYILERQYQKAKGG